MTKILIADDDPLDRQVTEELGLDHCVGHGEPMTPTSVTATPASLSASATTAAPEASPVSADFLALLLLTLCVGTETSQSESDTPDPTDDQPVVQVGSVTINLADVTTIGTPTI